MALPQPRRSLTTSLILLGCALAPMLAGAAPYAGTHVRFSFSGTPDGVWNYDQRFTVQDDAPGMYYAASFYFKKDSSKSGYFGLQPDGRMPVSGANKKLVRFSLWNANGFQAPAGSECAKFSHEGTGIECARPYAYEVGRPYTLRTWRLRKDAEGVWWGMWIIDASTGTETHVANIRLPGEPGNISSVIQFNESYRQQPKDDCASISSSEVHFAAPLGNNGAAKAVGSGHKHQWACANPRYEAASRNGVSILRMGR